MKIYNLIGFLFLVVCNFQQTFSQVTIGDSGKVPAEYSLLQLEKTEQLGGFRLPRLTQQDRDALKVDLNSKPLDERTAANGLVVYNIETGLMEYWTGTDWKTLESSQIRLLTENGVTAIDPLQGGLKLGGQLNKETTLSLNGNNLNVESIGGDDKFIVSDATGGDQTFSVSNGNVGVGTSDPQAKVDIRNTDSTLPGLRISNSNEKAGYVLVSDQSGNATWRPLKPLSSVIYGTINNSAIYGGDGNVNTNVTTNPLRLTKGKWLVVAKYSARVDDRVGQGSNPHTYYSYIGLSKSNSPIGGLTSVSMTGSLPSQTRYTPPSGDNANSYYVTPQIFYFVEVEAEEEYYHVFANSSRFFKTTPAYGGSYFYALRIDVINN